MIKPAPCIVCHKLPGIFTPDMSIPPQWCLVCSLRTHAGLQLRLGI